MNMKIKSPISVDRIQFYTYDCNQTDELVFINRFPFDDRQDFLLDDSFAGIAIKVEISNKRYDKGARRNLSFSLVDMTIRCEVAKQQLKVSLAKDGFMDCYMYFPTESSSIVGNHTYKLVICDENVSETLTERIVHLFDKSAMGDPAMWYEVCDGGVRPSWKSDVFKSLNTADEHDYLVQFNVTPQNGCNAFSIMPELEIRLYYPEGQYVKAFFKEPFCYDLESYNSNRWTVECPFETIDDINGVFYAELLCMEYPIAGFVFDTLSREDISGSWYGHEIQPMEEYSPVAAMELIDEYLSRRNESVAAIEADSLDEVLDRFITSERKCPDEEEITGNHEESAHSDDCNECVSEQKCKQTLSFDHLIGIKSVKEKLTLYEHVVRFNKMRATKGLPVSAAPLHAMFLGSPGTGKTTVAKMMGEMLRRAGVLSKGHVIVRERATLLGECYNSESEKTLAAIEKAQGGILFIDEAYQLYQENDLRDPSKFVIETLLTALADDSNRDWMLVLAGYPDEMKRMFDMNPGFKSRIPDSNIYTFDDFTETELMEIAESYLAGNSYTMTPEAQCALAARLKRDYAQREKNFGNARHVINMIQTEILPSMAARVINEGVNDERALTEIQIADIPSLETKPKVTRPRVGFTI